MDILIEELGGSLWVASLKAGRLEGLEVDPIYEEVRWGSIYWAKVTSINAALDAAYLDLDGDNSGILYNSDVRIETKDGSIQKGGAEPIGKTLRPGQMVAVQAKTAYLPKDTDLHTMPEHKMPQMSMDVTLPGRYMIYCPSMKQNRLSMRIRDKTMRTQLETMMDQIEDMKGFILRAAAANTQTDILVSEGQILQAAWVQIDGFMEGNSPQLIALGPDSIERTLSDQATHQIDRIEVVTMDHYEMAEEWCSLFAPDLVPKIEPIEMENADQDLALFEYRDIMGQIEDLSQHYTLLQSGGNIIIQETSALTAVDVNRGGDKGSNLSVNIEAALEVVRQIRLRNIGGIIVVDFLNMKSKADKTKLSKALEEAIQNDPCTVQLHGLTNLGLFEITRKRRTPALQERIDS